MRQGFANRAPLEEVRKAVVLQKMPLSPMQIYERVHGRPASNWQQANAHVGGTCTQCASHPKK